MQNSPETSSLRLAASDAQEGLQALAAVSDPECSIEVAVERALEAHRCLKEALSNVGRFLRSIPTKDARGESAFDTPLELPWPEALKKLGGTPLLHAGMRILENMGRDGIAVRSGRNVPALFTEDRPPTLRELVEALPILASVARGKSPANLNDLGGWWGMGFRRIQALEEFLEINGLNPFPAIQQSNPADASTRV